jgi:hypothetical protein
MPRGEDPTVTLRSPRGCTAPCTAWTGRRGRAAPPTWGVAAGARGTGRRGCAVASPRLLPSTPPRLGRGLARGSGCGSNLRTASCADRQGTSEDTHGPGNALSCAHMPAAQRAPADGTAGVRPQPLCQAAPLWKPRRMRVHARSRAAPRAVRGGRPRAPPPAAPLRAARAVQPAGAALVHAPARG